MSEQNINTLLNHPAVIAILALGVLGLLIMALRPLFKRGTQGQIDASNVTESLKLATTAMAGIDRLENSMVAMQDNLSQAILNTSAAVKAVADAQTKILALEERSQGSQEDLSSKLASHEEAAKERGAQIEKAIVDLGGFVSELTKAVGAQSGQMNAIAEIPLRVLQVIAAADTPDEIRALSDKLRTYSDVTSEIANKTTKPLVMSEAVEAKFKEEEGKEKREETA